MTPALVPDSKPLTQLKTTLARIRHFDGLPKEVQKRIAATAVERHFKAGQIIYLEGEPAEFVYLLEKGWIKATRMSREGREQAMLFLRPTEVFGDIAVALGATYPGTVVALEEVDVWEIPAKVFLDLISREPTFAMAVIRRLGERVLHFIELVEDLSLRSVEARLASTLLRYAQVHEGQLIVPRHEWTTFDEMAVRLGTVRDVLSRALKTLEAEGLIKVQKQRIILIDQKGLEQRGSS